MKLIVLLIMLWAAHGVQSQDYKIEINNDKNLGYSVHRIDWKISKGSYIVIYKLNEDTVCGLRAVFQQEDKMIEWLVIYQNGVPLAAEQKYWRALSVDFNAQKEKEIGEALIKIKSFSVNKAALTNSDEATKKQWDSLMKSVNSFGKKESLNDEKR